MFTTLQGSKAMNKTHDVKTISQIRRSYWIAAVLFLLSVAFFIVFPKFDLAITGQFYSLDDGFIWRDQPVVHWVYLIFAKIHFAFLLGLLVLLAFPKDTLKEKLSLSKRQLSYLLAVLLLGPGLLVNGVLKNHSVGRARPANVVEFGGDDTFTMPFQYSGQCQKNCSFVSGHAAIGFYVIAFAWAFGRRRWLTAGIALGAFVGFGRILQGGHFFSDVLFSFWSVYFTSAIMAVVFRLNAFKADTP